MDGEQGSKEKVKTVNAKPRRRKSEMEHKVTFSITIVKAFPTGKCFFIAILTIFISIVVIIIMMMMMIILVIIMFNLIAILHY